MGVSARRLPLLALGLVCLVFGITGGLARLTPALAAPSAAIGWHGALMVSAFLGTVIALERAVALGGWWPFAAPLSAGLGGLLVLGGMHAAGLALLAGAGVVFALCSAVFLYRQPSVETATLAAGALAWLAGNVALDAGGAPLPWWIAFLVLTIAGERLELSRYLKRGAFPRIAFIALAAALFVSPADASMRLQGVVLALLAAWLLAYDLARFTVRQKGLPRFVAWCLLPGYGWLALGGALLAAGGAAGAFRDTALHAVFLGFVFSMIFGHAPVILPAVLRVRFPWHPVLYLPLALLHASLAVRAFVSTALGAWGNAAAIALFIVTAFALGARRARAPRGRAA